MLMAIGSQVFEVVLVGEQRIRRDVTAQFQVSLVSSYQVTLLVTSGRFLFLFLHVITRLPVAKLRNPRETTKTFLRLFACHSEKYA